MAEKPKEKSKSKAKKTASTMSGMEAVVMRNNFYRDSYRMLLMITLLMLCVMSALIGYIYYQHISQPKPKYFAVFDDNKLIEPITLNKPNLSANAVLNWATDAATRAYSYDFVKYRDSLQEVRSYFTKSGYSKYISALKESRNLETVRAKKLVVQAVPLKSPVITEERVIGNRYTWKLELPLLVTYQSANETIRQEVVLSMTIIRVPTLDSAKGIGISSFIANAGGA